MSLFVLLFAAGSDECTSGFLDFSETSSMIVPLPNSNLSIDNPLSDFIQWIFPNVKFTCNGFVSTWRLRVNTTNTAMDPVAERPFPQITTWRLDPESTFDANGVRETFNQQTIINVSQANVKMESGFTYYEYIPSTPTPVQAGDIVGIMMPAADEDRAQSLRPLFLRLPQGNASSFSCVLLPNSNIQPQHLLLVDGMCTNQRDQQSEYIPLVSPIFSELPKSIIRFTVHVISITHSPSQHTFVSINVPYYNPYLYSTSHYHGPHTFTH